jgi:NAD(P)-dependent dehydrogenase (short-subunit alcohol dehydrogenase family)
MMEDRNILITGGTSGMGKATAIQLAKMGARLLLVSRNREKGEAAVSEIKQSSGNEAITFLAADLSLVREMRRIAEHTRQTFDRLDVLMHSAGGTFPRQRTLTDEGFELAFAIQYLARFVLTNELLDLLKAAPNPKVLGLAGGAWGSKQVDFDDLQSEKSYGKFKSIAKTAALNYLLTLGQLARYPDIAFYNYGPGLVRTATVTENQVMTSLFFNTVGRLFSRSPEQAADDIVTLLTGEYPAGFYGISLEQKDPPTAAESDAALSEELWNYSEKLVANLAVVA